LLKSEQREQAARALRLASFSTNPTLKAELEAAAVEFTKRVDELEKERTTDGP
jgi:hypothetical protein